jgi:uncharacterized membrane protein (UPF0127 family)
MDLHLLTTPWQRALGAMFRTGLGDSGLVFLYPASAPRLFHTFFCPPLRLTALSEKGEVIFSRVIAPFSLVRIPPTRQVVEADPAAPQPSQREFLSLLKLPVRANSASWDESISPDRLVDKVLEQAVADMRRAYEVHQRSGPVRREVLRERFAPWERGDLCTAAIAILDGVGMYSIPEPAVSFSYQILQVERPYLEELAAASLAGQPWRSDFPRDCLRCGKPGSWRPVLRTPPVLTVETAWRYERPENAVPLCKRCAYRLEWSRQESLRIDLAWGLWGPRFEAFWMWHSAHERLPSLKVWDRETHPLWPPQFGEGKWETGSGAKEHAEPRPPEGVQRTQAHQAALARALGARFDPRPLRDTPTQFLLKWD